jgi:hypothetical protein
LKTDGGRALSAISFQRSASEHHCGSAWFYKRSKTSSQNAKKS